MSTMDLVVFGDQALDVSPHLRRLINERGTDPVLNEFLVRSYHSIRDQIGALPQHVRTQFPRFTCAEDVIFMDAEPGSSIPLEMALTCIYQLGTFMSQHEDMLGRPQVYPLGICTGALPAAAISASKSMVQLLANGVQAVAAAFRIGVGVVEMSSCLVSPQKPQSWVLHVTRSDAFEEALQRFLDESSLPAALKPYISARSFTSLSISGPPSTLQQLRDSPDFKDFRFHSAPIFGPYHAPHLYSQDDVDQILRGIVCRDTVCASTSAGHKTHALRSAVEQILIHPMSWPQSLEEVARHFESISASQLSLTTIGVSSSSIVHKMLKQTPLGDSLIPTPGDEQETSNGHTADTGGSNCKLAIIGMSGRYPAAQNDDEYWNLLFQGLDVHKTVPGSRWDTATHVDTTGARKNTSATPYGCWLDTPELFDAQHFNISPREAPQIDPAQRLALTTAYEAIEKAGLVPDATPSTRRDRVGVFFGTTANDWMETNSAQNIDTYFIPGGNRAFIPGRINYHFGFSGPSYAVDTACSSSLASLHLACNALWRREIDTAIAGGSNVLTNPDFTSGLDRGHFLSRTGGCKTFDDSADGYCRGEGVATVILKRLDDAMADKDPILGLVLSASTNHSAESVSITRPHVGAQKEVLRNILNRASTQPSDVGYVEMHGTGTQHGDASEMASVLDTMAPALDVANSSHARPAGAPLYLGSVKSNIGHGEAASGVCSLVKVLLMLRHNTVVPHCGIKTKINSKFPTDLTERNVHIATQPQAWHRASPSQPRKVIINNFSAAGGNTAILIEDAPARGDDVVSATDPRSNHLIAVSAKSKVSLEGNIKNMINYLEKNPAVDLGKLSYTTTARRIHHQFRVMVNATSAQQAQDQLTATLGTKVTRPKTGPKFFFAFTGQGAHFAGMGRELFTTFSLFSREFCRLDRLGMKMGFASALPALECTDDETFSSLGPVAIQLAGIYIQMALCKLMASWGIQPDAVVGHSLGEYPAMATAGILSDADAIYLVGSRAQLVANHCEWGTHSMLVVRGSVDDVRTILSGQGLEYEVSCINSPSETVLSGRNEHLVELRDALASKDLKCTMLKVPYAFHSAQMDPILEPFQELIKPIAFTKPRLAYLSSTEGTWINAATNFGASYLTKHTRNAVQIQDALRLASTDGSITDQTVFLEIGPHPAILPMVKANAGPQVACFASGFRGKPNAAVLADTLKGLYLRHANIDWSRYHHDFPASHEVLALPSYSWDLKPYWIQYVNDWSLRKGDPPIVSHGPSLESTTIHRVVSESSNGPKASIVIEANIARKDLAPLVQGHEVDGIPLCTPSVYGDMALSLGHYLIEKYRPQHKGQLVDVGDMTISKPLILREGATEQLLQGHAAVNWDTDSATLSMQTFDTRGKLQELAKCTLRFRDHSLLPELTSSATQVLAKIRALQEGISSGESARFNRPMVYRAIRPLARFHHDYRAIDEILLNSNNLHCACRLSFGTVKRDGRYNTHPAVIDALTQSCGFTMNCNDRTDLDEEVFMNHGWGSFQIFEPIDMDAPCLTYTEMAQDVDQLWKGDVVVFQNNRVVAFFGKIAIQRVPRRVLKTILSIEAGNKSRSHQQAHRKQEQTPIINGTSTPHEKNGDTAATASAPVVNGQSRPEHKSSTIVFDKVLQIISEEAGLEKSDLDDSTVFADAGIDSLLSLAITSRIRDELEVDLDLGEVLIEHPTVGELRTRLSPSPSSNGSVGNHTSPVSQSDDKVLNVQSQPSSNGPDNGTNSQVASSEETETNIKNAIRIISEESGIEEEALDDSTEFSEVGIDSLLSLVITSRLRDELEVDLPQDALFSECKTMGDVKRALGWQSTPTSGPSAATAVSGVTEQGSVESQAVVNGSQHTTSNLQRKQAVDQLVQRYTAGFGSSSTNGYHNPPSELPNATVVMVTGASGSLGSHLVHQLAPRSDVAQVVCLNRIKHGADPYERQAKAMRDKGLRNFDQLRPKLLVLQTDTSLPHLGLNDEQYRELVNSVTHLIHNAWPMSAKRKLDGFESQFQVMRNLLDFAHDVTVRRPPPFRFSFSQVSSIGVVGNHHIAEGKPNSHVEVPESRVDIDSVLGNGYSEAKWGMERMLDETLHKHSKSRFRPLVARLGQIAGSRTHYYWPPTEHFAFLVKSSKTLGALPDVPGKLYWTPVEDVAGTLIDLSLASVDPYPVYHIDSPVGQTWEHMNKILSDELKVGVVPFKQWIERVRQAPARDNPALALAEFLEDTYLRMSCGGLTLSVQRALEQSPTLNRVGPVGDEIVRKYILVWREIGFLAKN